MASGKKFYKRPNFITLIIALLIAAVAVPKTLALTARQAKKLDVQVEGEDVWGEAVEGVLVLKGSTTPNAPGLARPPKSSTAAQAPADKRRNFGTQAPASRNTTLAIQPKLAASGSEAGLPGALDAKQTVAKSPIIDKRFKERHNKADAGDGK